MTIEFRHDYHFYGLWFLDIPAMQRDVLAAVYTDELGELRGIYRTREIQGDDPWNNADEKHWFTLGFPTEETAPQVVKKMQQLMGMLQATVGGELSFLDLQGKDGTEAARVVMQQPWAHVKVEDA